MYSLTDNNDTQSQYSEKKPNKTFRHSIAAGVFEMSFKHLEVGGQNEEVRRGSLNSNARNYNGNHLRTLATGGLSSIGEEGIPLHINKHLMKRHTKAFITPRDSLMRVDNNVGSGGRVRHTLHN